METDEEYCSRLTDMTIKSFTVPLLAIGLKLNIYDAMERISKPATFNQIANEAGLKPRYVQEWCKGMAIGNVIDFDSENDTFYLSPSKMTQLKDISITAQFSVDTGNTRVALLECMKIDGPQGFVPWDHGDFSWRMQRDRELWLSKEDCIKKFLDVVPNLLEKMDKGIKVCEVGSNYGSVLLQMAKHYPNSSFVGYDICEEVCVSAQHKAQKENVTNVHYETQDLFKFPPELHNSFDFLYVFDVVHDVGDPLQCIKCLQQILKPGGFFSIVDVRIHSDLKDNIGNFPISYIYPVSMSYCLGNSMNDGGEGAGAGYGMENICKDIKAAGLEVVSMQPVPYCESLNLTVCRKPL